MSRGRGRGRGKRQQGAGPRVQSGGGVSRRTQGRGNRRFQQTRRQHGSLDPIPGTSHSAPEPVPQAGGMLSRFAYDHRGNLLTPATPELDRLRGRSKVVALDCEMVGIAPNSDKNSTLARVSIVNEHGSCLYDSFAKPPVPVLDYRTDRSGVRASDLRGAPPAQQVKKEVADLLYGRILVGHSLENDLLALGLENFPLDSVRDTAIYFLPAPRSPRSPTPGLKSLVKNELGIEIQNGEHNSITDAQAVMALYRKHRRDWEWPRGDGSGEETWILEKRLERVYNSGKFSTS